MSTDPREPGSEEGDETTSAVGDATDAAPQESDADVGAAAKATTDEPAPEEPGPAAEGANKDDDDAETITADDAEAVTADDAEVISAADDDRIRADDAEVISSDAVTEDAVSVELAIADDDILSIDDAGVTATPHHPRPPTPPPGTPTPTFTPTEFTIAVPTALDRYLEAEGARTIDDRITALREALEAAPKKRKGEIAYELGELYLGTLGDEAKAVKAYGVALRSDPSLRANLWAIRRIFYRRGLWPNLIKLIGAELRFVGSDRARADLELERGRIHEDRLADPVSAKSCFERAVAHDATFVPALLALERRCLSEQDDETLAMVWRRLADATEEEERKLTYLVDLARAKSRAGNESAFDVLDEAAGLGELATVSRERARAARELGNPEQMVASLEELVADQLASLGPAGLPPPAAREPGEPPDPAEHVRLTIIAARRQQARILARDLDSADRAWSALEQALAANPGDNLVLADLTDLAEASGRFDELASLVESWQAQEAAPERARALALRRVSALRRSGDSASAQALLSQLAATYPGYLPIAAIREVDASEAGDVSRLIDVFAEAAESAELGSLHGEGDGEPDVAVACELFTSAGGAAQLAGDLERARSLYSRALEVAGTHGERDSRANSIIESTAEAARDGLVVCFERAGQWDEIASPLSDQLAGDRDPLWRIRAAHAALAADYRADADGLDSESAETTESDNKNRALELLASIGDELSSGELMWMAALAIACGDSGREAQALELAAGRQQDPATAAEMLGRAGRAVELSDPRRAAELYRAALVSRPDDSLVRGALAGLLRRQKDWSALAEQLRESASAASDPRGPAPAWLELATLYEDRIGERAAAADAYREVLEIDPDSPAALAGLVRCSDGDQRTDALTRASQSSELGTSLVASLELARVQLEGDSAAEAEASVSAAQAVENDLGFKTRAASVLAIEVAAHIGDPFGLSEALERAADGARPAVAAELLAASGWQSFLAGDSQRAAELFATARDRDNRNHGALLGALLVADGEEEAIAADTLASALEGDALAVSMLRGAGVHAVAHADEARGNELLSRAVRRAPSDLSSAIALTELTLPTPANADAMAIAYGRRAQAGGDLAAVFALGRARSLAATGRLREAGELALELARTSESDPAPLALLADVCRLGGDSGGEAEARLELADRVVSKDARARHLRRAAELFDTELAQPAAAARAYWQLCELENSPAARTRLGEILAAEGDFGSLWELTSSEIERAEGAEDRARALVARAGVRIQIADRHGAMRDIKRAREEDESAAEAAGATSMAAEAMEWVELPAGADAEVVCASIAERADALADSAARARELVDLATIARDSLGDRERAAAAIATARDLDPTNLEAAARAGQVAEAAVAIRAGLKGQSSHRAGYQKLAAALELLGDTGESALAREVADALAGVPPQETLDYGPLSENKRPLDVAVFDLLGSRRKESHAAAEALWEKLADAVSRGTDPSPADVGAELSDRIGVRDLGKRSPIAAALYERLRLHAEIYLVDSRREWSLVTSANRQMIFLSPDVADAETAKARFILGAALVQCRERTGTLMRLSPDRVATYFAAARGLAGFEGSPLGAIAAEVPEVTARLAALLPGRVVSELGELGDAFAALERLGEWMEEARRRAERFGLAISGDIGEAARAALPRGRSISSNPRVLELLAFAASDAHLEIRRALGLSS